MTDDAPPLGQRPSEPRPGKESLEHPRGADGDGGNGDGNGKGTCPDCGLPFGEHPEYHLHDGSQGNPGWADVDLGDADMEADPLPGQALDSEVGGDPAES